MPVIACPDCSREVSTIASSCPHCGRPSPAGTTPIVDTGPPTQQEETLWKGTPAWSLLAGKILAIILTMIVIPVLAHFAAKSAPDLDASAKLISAGWWLTAALVLIQLALFGLALARLLSTLYTITNQRVMIETGLLTKALSEIDLRYIDDSQFEQGVIHRMLGVGNVTLVSSDKTTPVYVLRGIRDPRGVRELIRSHAYKVSQRQIFTRAT
ncbi:MAG TPA: PH domain-containing protein [Thermoanaerobaculia bacterium]|nr:PH domain-containing protein [Thermoanaerobaculia bacterium]